MRLILSSIALILVFFTESASGFTPSTIFEATIKSLAIYDLKLKRFAYSYEVINSPGSQQSIKDFGIAYEVFNLTDIKSPVGWEPTEEFGYKQVLVWYYIGRSNSPIPPGRQQAGFSFVSPGRPVLRQWYGRSSFKYVPQYQDEVRQIQDGKLFNFYKNSKTGVTVTPGPNPTSNVKIEIEYLNNEFHRIYRQDDISKSNILRSLEAKIQTAQASIAQGGMKAAKNQLNAFSNEICAQSGKAVGQDAATILNVNAEYLLSLI